MVATSAFGVGMNKKETQHSCCYSENIDRYYRDLWTLGVTADPAVHLGMA